MLKLLGAAEGTIRRSPNSRLHIETLLVQWTMLDRTVELSEVIRALRSGSADGRVDTGRRAAGARNTLVGRAPERARRAAVARSAPGVLTTPALEAAWGDILDAVGTRSRMVREALGHAAPLEAGDGLVALQVSDSEVHLEGLERGSHLFGSSTVPSRRARTQTRFPPSGWITTRNSKSVYDSGGSRIRPLMLSLKHWTSRPSSSLQLPTAEGSLHPGELAFRLSDRQMADLSQLLQLGQQMQGRLTKMQSELKEQTVTGSAGGGMVKITADGQGQVRSVRIDPSVASDGDVEMLEDLVLAAMSDAQRKAQELYRSEMTKVTGGMPLPFQLPL